MKKGDRSVFSTFSQINFQFLKNPKNRELYNKIPQESNQRNFGDKIVGNVKRAYNFSGTMFYPTNGAHLSLRLRFSTLKKLSRNLKIDKKTRVSVVKVIYTRFRVEISTL